MTKEDYYHDFLKIREMKSSTRNKIRMLGEMLGSYENVWRVVGITENALITFSNHNFKKVSRMGVNRSHIVDRNKTYREMIEGPLMDCDTWWKFFIDNDKTILATSSENMSNSMSKIYNIDLDNLFKASGFAWKHGKNEAEFLKSLHEQIIVN